MSPETFASALGTLRNAGSVFGLIFSRGHEIIFQNTPFAEAKAAEFALTVDDIAYYFELEKRSPDQLAFGFDGANLLILMEGELRVILFYHQNEEVDFVARAARSFLKDYQTAVLVTEMSAPKPMGSGTQKVPVAPAR